MATKEIDDWEDVEFNDPRVVLPRLFPGARVTSTSRSSDDPLSRKNPNSLHIDNPEAFDVAPIPGVKFEDFISTLRQNGYEVDQAINETGSGKSAWATGDHWHGGRLRFNPDLIEDWEEAPGEVPQALGLSGGTVPTQTATAAPTARPKAFSDRLINAYQQEANRGFTGWLARNIMALTGINTPEEFDKLPYDERMRILNESAANINRNYEQMAQEDPNGALDLVAGLVGGTLGGVDPTSAIMAGPTILSRMAFAGGMAGASNLAEQGFDIGAGIREDFDPVETGLQTVGGGALQGGIEKFAGLINSRIKGGASLDEVNADLKAAGSDQQVTPGSYMAAQDFFQKNPDADPLAVVNRTAEEVPYRKPQTLPNPDNEIAGTRGRDVLPNPDTLPDRAPVEPLSIVPNAPEVEPFIPNTRAGATPLPSNSNVKTMTPEEAEGFIQNYQQSGGVEKARERQLQKDAERRKVLDTMSDGELADLAESGDELAIQVQKLREIPDDPLYLNDPNGEGGPQQPYDLGPPEVMTGGGEPPVEPPVGEDVVSRLTTALKGASRLTNAQKALYSAERRSRLEEVGKARATTSGRAGFTAEKAALKGEYPKVEFEGIEDQFTPQEINSLFDMVKANDNLGWYGQITARSGLNRILTGQLPRPSEIDAMSKVFDPAFIKEALNKRSTMGKAMDAAANAVNLPRSVMSSWDLSGMGRQGIFMIGRKEWFNSFKQQFNALGSERGYQGVMDSIKALPHYDKMEANGLDFTTGGHDLSAREEAFMSRWAEQVPGVKASERAYNAGLNNLRATSFNNIVDKWERLEVELTPDRLNSLAKYINDATGRGNFQGKWAQAGPLLNSLFFSPRLIASRVNLLNPVNYMKMDPYVRKEAIRDLMAFGTVATTVLGLAAAAGADVETDTNSSDFGKIKVGDTRYDILGGFQQYIRLGSQLITGKRKTLKGETQELGKDFGTPGAYETSMNFLRSKLSPVVAYTVNAVEGENIIGEPFDPMGDTANLFVPLFLQDLANAYADEGFEGFAKTLPASVGIGNQTFDINAPRGQEKPPLVERVYNRAKEDLGFTPVQVESKPTSEGEDVDDWEDISEGFSDEDIKDWK